LANLFWWCDREKGVAGMVASQILPFGGIPRVSSVTSAARVFRSHKPVAAVPGLLEFTFPLYMLRSG